MKRRPATLFVSATLAIVSVALPVEVRLAPEAAVIVDIAGNFFAFVAGVMAVAIQCDAEEAEEMKRNAEATPRSEPGFRVASETFFAWVPVRTSRVVRGELKPTGRVAWLRPVVRKIAMFETWHEEKVTNPQPEERDHE